MSAGLASSPPRGDGIPALARLRLAALPTPLQAYPRLGEAIGSRALKGIDEPDDLYRVIPRSG